MLLPDMNITFLNVLAAGWIVPVLVIGVLIGIALFLTVGQYNGLVKLRNRFRNSFAQIDVQLKRRHDLIPNLVETAKTYMKHCLLYTSPSPRDRG